ncbi:MAG TPA: LegC family aminotransferase [Xanthobacteraceae bacterium]|nr:LegC family aminotransferase [Xanthobacteraceae bacterium]
MLAPSAGSRTHLADTIVAAVGSVLGPAEALVPLHEPEFAGREWEYVKDCLDTGWVSSVGAYVDRFERDLADYTGAGHAVAVVNGTAALHLALVLVGVDPGDEVIVPTLTFVATANAVAYCGAVPHFAEISEATLGLDAGKLDRYLADILERRGGRNFNRITGRPVSAVVAMHTFGHPADLDHLIEVCARHDLPLVEDAAESLGSTWYGRHCGTFAPVAALSFNGNKVVTTGGGGAILTSDPALARRAKHLSTTAKVPHPWLYEHDAVGFNYRLPNLNAALGCAQLERIESFIAEKRRLAAAYDAAFATLENVSFVREPAGARSNYWLCAITLDPAADVATRDAVLERLNAANYMARPAWTLMHRLAPYASAPRMPDLSAAETIARTLINLPSSPRLARALAS